MPQKYKQAKFRNRDACLIIDNRGVDVERINIHMLSNVDCIMLKADIRMLKFCWLRKPTNSV